MKPVLNLSELNGMFIICKRQSHSHSSAFKPCEFKQNPQSLTLWRLCGSQRPVIDTCLIFFIQQYNCKKITLRSKKYSQSDKRRRTTSESAVKLPEVVKQTRITLNNLHWIILWRSISPQIIHCNLTWPFLNKFYGMLSQFPISSFIHSDMLPT